MRNGVPHAVDITPADSAEIFRSLFLSFPDSLIVADGSGRIVLANAEAGKLLGYTVDQLVGLNVDALVPEAIRPQHVRYRHDYSERPRARPMGTQMDLVARRRDGSEVMVEIALSPLQIAGRPLVVAAIRDIGAYPRFKQALRRARYSEHLAHFGRLAVDSRDVAVLLAGVPSIAIHALEADAAAVFLLHSRHGAFQLAAHVGLQAEHPDEPIANGPDSLPGYVLRSNGPVLTDHGHEERFRFPVAYADAQLKSGLMIPLMDRGATIGVLAVHSRTEQRFGDDEIRFLASLSNLLSTSLQRAQSEEVLSHAQRLETVGQLTGGIAHDFNNLLTIVRGNLQVLEEMPAVANDAVATQAVAAAARASRRGAELTSKLLAFSRRQRLQPGHVDVSSMLDALCDMLRRTLDQRVRIAIDVVDDCPQVLADPGQLETALLNIVINARDAMPDGGMLRFDARPCVQLPVEVDKELQAIAPPALGYVEIAISDSGCGMTDDVKERAFEPFFTTKEAGRGTGLGLSTVYGFVKQSKGAIALDSAPGRGTHVSLFLPVAPPREAPAVLPDPAPPGPAPGLRVLLVEDDPDVRAVALTFLDRLQCRVTAAATGEEAVRLLQDPNDFELLLTDIALGAGMRGTELASQAQDLRPGLSILLVSGYSAELLEVDQHAPADWELLQKPFSRDELARAIARVAPPR